METALDSLFQWFCQNGMKVNAAKTQLLVLGTPAMLKNVPPVSINFCGTRVHDVKTVKNLGLHMDRHLTYQDHIDDVVRRCTGTLIALSHARHVIPSAVLKGIVQALAMSSVRYCMSVYGSCGVTQLKRIQKIINFCARVVTGRRKYDHVSDAIEQMGWLRADELVEYHTVSAVQRAMSTGSPEYIHQTIGQRADEIHDHDTRHANRISIPMFRTKAGRRRLCYRGVEMLNKGIDKGIDPMTAVPVFRASLKRAILSRRE